MRSTFLPKFTWFSEREIHILRTRVWLDDPAKGKKKKKIGKAAFRKAVSSRVLICRPEHKSPPKLTTLKVPELASLGPLFALACQQRPSACF